MRFRRFCAPTVSLLSGLILLLGCPGLITAQDNPPAAGSESPAAADPQAPAENPQEPENPFPNRVKAPDNILDGGIEWLNTSGEIRLKDLRGKIVLLDFWTYCCINCMHVLPDLKYLEEKYPNELVVIGVHSAKFDNEKDSEAIRQAIVRYEIEHPVVNDANMVLWRKFGTRAWPTLALLDPEGYYLGSQSGEGNRELFDVVIQKLIAYHAAKGTLDRTPVRFDLERNRVPSGPLKYPGKVLADEAGSRLFISDSNHNRIVIAALDGKLLEVVGDGQIGSRDGGYSEARFDHPQGMELVGERLYVADTENHQIRVIDLEKKQVTTLAGTGEQARSRAASGPLSMALNSPWALAHVDGTLYIAMAGPHQIWRHDLGTDSIGVFAGSGREDVLNGPHDTSAFAQPSGIVSDGKALYVVDSEGSAIRRVPLDPDEPVSTIAGTSELPRGQSLFAFGDVDGVGDEARLQHPLGIARQGGELFLADSYNHKIKRLNLESRECTTWLGDGTAGKRLDPPRFSEPAGLSVAGNRLFIADTNNHRILVAAIDTGSLTEFVVEGLQAPAAPQPESTPIDPGNTAPVVENARTRTANGLVRLTHEPQLPEGYKLNPEAPVIFRVQAVAGDSVPAEFLSQRHEAELKDGRIQIDVPVGVDAGETTLKLALSYQYCRDGVGGVCRLKTETWQIPLVFGPDEPADPIRLMAPEGAPATN